MDRIAPAFKCKLRCVCARAREDRTCAEKYTERRRARIVLRNEETVVPVDSYPRNGRYL